MGRDSALEVREWSEYELKARLQKWQSEMLSLDIRTNRGRGTAGVIASSLRFCHGVILLPLSLKSSLSASSLFRSARGSHYVAQESLDLLILEPNLSATAGIWPPRLPLPKNIERLLCNH